MTENTMNEKQRTSIFRKEALQRFERQEHGPMLLARSNHSWLLVSLAFAITFFCTLYLFLGSYRPRATVSGILVPADGAIDRKSTRLNSSHLVISYAVFCLKKKRYRIWTPDL